MDLNIPYLIALTVVLFLFQLYVSIRMLFYGGYRVGQKVVQLLNSVARAVIRRFASKCFYFG